MTTTPRDANKVPEEWENPFDALLLRATEATLPMFHATGHTPNMLTTYSFVSGLGAVWALWNGQVVAFGCLYLLSYAFDCADGQMARRYDMVSPFGDLYDHATDLVVYVLLILVVCLRYRVHWVHGLVIGVAVLLTLMHLGCQQRALDREAQQESLDLNRPLCPDAGAIVWTRFFGTGTLVLLTVAYVCYLHAAGRQRAPASPPPPPCGSVPAPPSTTPRSRAAPGPVRRRG